MMPFMMSPPEPVKVPGDPETGFRPKGSTHTVKWRWPPALICQSPLLELGPRICFMRKPTTYDFKGYKICPRCLLGRPNSDYYFVGHVRNHLSHCCKSCTRERAKL